MVGLSATPERIDKYERLAIWGLGDIIDCNKLIGIDNKKKEFRCKVIIVKYKGNPVNISPVINKTN